MAFKTPIIQDLVSIRKAWNLSVADVAELAGVNDVTIEGFESGNRFPRLDTLLRWADALGCNVGATFRGTENAGSGISDTDG